MSRETLVLSLVCIGLVVAVWLFGSCLSPIPGPWNAPEVCPMLVPR